MKFNPFEILRRKGALLSLPVLAGMAVALGACAVMGRPEGGPLDETPPVFVKSNPAPGALNVRGDRIEIWFDENVQIEDAANKVVVSPAQVTQPVISSNGRKVTVELRDTLRASTSYTVDFTDAVKDLNEGNVLDGFSFDFSTGPSIDTLRISGMVFEAATLEPAQGMVVGVYSNLSDTALTTLPMERVTKTNALGQFTLRNLAPGTYRIFAINDLNRDYKWDRSEDVAFFDATITPEARYEVHTDTLRSRTEGVPDSIVHTPLTYFTPNDIILTWFNEGYKAQYLQNYERKKRNVIGLRFGAPSDTMPRVVFAGDGPLHGKDIVSLSALKSSQGMDTLEIWLRDSALIKLDTIPVAVQYLKPDSLERMQWVSDTLALTFSEPRQSKKKKSKEELAADSVARENARFLTLEVTSNRNLDVNKPLTFTVSEPLDSFAQSMVHLEYAVDTLWDTVAAPVIRKLNPLQPMDLVGIMEWEPDTKYRLTVDSLAMTGIYGHPNRKMVYEFKTPPLSDYSTVNFRVTGVPDSVAAVVELLSASDKPVAQAPVEDGTAYFEYIKPGTYYARLYIDANHNGRYDTGNLSSGSPRQPEEVYYYPRKLNLMKNWEVSQSWDIFAVPLDRQKPLDIKKNKPKEKRTGGKDRKQSEEEPTDEDDGYIPPPGVG